MNVSFYVRPWSYKYFEYIGECLGEQYDFSLVSDFKGLCKNDLSTSFYSVINNPEKLDKIDISHVDNGKVILQDRLLRSLPYEDAVILIKAAQYSILDYFENNEIDAFISVTIDSYIIDLIELNCKNLNIPFMGIHLTMISGYTLVTSRGEINELRSVQDKELNDVYERITSSNYSVNYVKEKNPPFELAFKRWVRSLIKTPYFELFRRYKNDRLNYHYLATIAVSKSRSSIVFLNYRKYFCNSWASHISKNLKKIYIPLQFHPECNSEYWSNVSIFLPYEEGLLDVVEILNKKYQIIIKEHPEMIGLRNPMFYKNLQSMGNVIIVPVGVSQEKLLDECDVSATWNSSIGIESILRGKRVITFAEPLYVVGNIYLNIDAKVDMLEKIDKFINTEHQITLEEKKNVIRKVLSTSFVGHPDECFFDPLNKNKMENANSVLKSLKDLLPTWLSSYND